MAYKIISGYEKYVFFDDGRIWSRSRGHFLKPSINGMGYPQIPFAITGTKKRKSQRDVLNRKHFKTVPEFQPISNTVCLISR